MAVDMYLQIEGIPGESTDDAHSEWIQVRSYSHGVSQPASDTSATGGLTGGRADFEELTIEKTLDVATPDLNIYCAKGTHIPTVVLELCLATGDKHTFMKYELTDCIIKAVAPGGASTDDIKPTEAVKIAYGKIKWEYTPIDSTGSPGSPTDRTWNLEKNIQE
jgi:type VI secretion system secreted protein Hcp